MFTPNQIKKCLLPGIVLLTSIASSTALADPVVLPPDRSDLVAVPPVFCFKVTGGDVLAGGGARLQFEVLNWTGEDAHHVMISQNPSLTANTGGSFSSVIPEPLNGWHVNDPLGGPQATGVGQGNVIFSANEGGLFGDFSAPSSAPQPPLVGIDLDPNNDLDFSDAPALPSPIDSGPNVLDGFLLDFPDLDIFERVVLQWTLFDEFFSNVDSDVVINPFSFGTFQIDRASNGSIRVATYFSIGTNLSDIDANPPLLDEALTEQNAITLPGTGSLAVPAPAAAWLIFIGLVSLSRYRKAVL